MRKIHSRRSLRITDIVRTKKQLTKIKWVIYPIFVNMGLSRNKIKQIKIRFGKDKEFIWKGCNAFYVQKDNEVVIKRGSDVIIVITDIAHEKGHAVTKLGKFGIFGEIRRNIIGETSAYNFEVRFINTFNKMKGTHIKLKNGDFIESMSLSPVHYISRVLKFVPLGYWIRKEYLA